MSSNKEKINLAIIGSGAIAEEGYLPATEHIHNLVVTHLVDIDAERSKEVAMRFGVPGALTDYRQIFGKVNAVVVATPPSSHAKITIDCLKNGINVLCEKPLAPTAKEAREMVKTADQKGMHLAVGMVRRLNWSSRIVKRLVTLGILGKIDRFEIEEGWEFNWPLRTGHIFQGNNRGVVDDTGTHLIDLILWILGSQKAHIIECRDDNWGGIEANANIKMYIELQSHRIEGRIDLSFTRKLRNTIRIFGENGCLETSTVGSKKVRFFPSGITDEPITLFSPNMKYKKNQDFIIQVSNFADSIINGSVKYVPAKEAVKIISLIEECYQIRKPTAQAWEKLHLKSYFRSVTNE